MPCVFCDIVNKVEPASIVYEDSKCLGFMNIRPVRHGECMVIPKEHIDHFTDISDELSAHIVVIAQTIGRKMFEVLSPSPQRIGYVVHGYGVPHAHFLIIPMHGGDDITSARCLSVQDGKVTEDLSLLPLVARDELNDVANILKIERLI